MIAKRARDIGLPGWLAAIVTAALTGGAQKATGHAGGSGIGGLLVLILAFLPTDMLRRGS